MIYFLLWRKDAGENHLQEAWCLYSGSTVCWQVISPPEPLFPHLWNGANNNTGTELLGGLNELLCGIRYRTGDWLIHSLFSILKDFKS